MGRRDKQKYELWNLKHSHTENISAEPAVQDLLFVSNERFLFYFYFLLFNLQFFLFAPYPLRKSIGFVSIAGFHPHCWITSSTPPFSLSVTFYSVLRNSQTASKGPFSITYGIRSFTPVSWHTWNKTTYQRRERSKASKVGTGTCWLLQISHQRIWAWHLIFKLNCKRCTQG